MAKAAYRAGEALFDERTGQLFDYTDGAGRVVATRIMVREAPNVFADFEREERGCWVPRYHKV